jgi:disulfide bond formation protein DsbB
MPLPIAVGLGVAGLMTAVWAGLSRLIFSKGGAWVAAIMTWLGVGIAAHELVFDPMLAYMASAFSGLPSAAGEWLGFLNVDKYCSLVISGYVGGAVKSVVLRKLATA